MNKLALGIAFAALLAASSASADVLYDGGAIDGTTSGWTINYGYVVGNTFDLSTASTVTSIENIGLWLSDGDTTSSVDWAIVSDPTGGTTYGSGTASLSTSFLSTNAFGYDVNSASFSIPALDLAAGSYWLVLQNAVSAENDPVYWDINGGPSEAWENTIGFNPRDEGGCDANQLTECSDAFQVLGTSGVATPEPLTLSLFGAGLAGLGAARRRRKAV